MAWEKGAGWQGVRLLINPLVSSAISPATSDGAALGSTSLMWSDLFLASGAVVNFNNGDVTLTHSADTLTLAGGSLSAQHASASTVTLGSGTGTGRLLAVYDEQVSAAGVCNSGTGSDDTLFTIPTIPANTLARDGQTIRVKAEIFTAANGNSKQFGFAFQGNQLSIPAGGFNNANGRLTAVIRRVSATRVNLFVFAPISVAVVEGARSLNLSVNDLTTNTSTLVLTGRSATAANDSCSTGVTTYITP